MTAKCSCPCILKYYRKNLVKNVWPANSALLFYVSTQYVKTVKSLDNNRYFQLIRWSCVNAFKWGPKGLWFKALTRILC